MEEDQGEDKEAEQHAERAGVVRVRDREEARVGRVAERPDRHLRRAVQEGVTDATVVNLQPWRRRQQDEDVSRREMGRRRRRVS